MSAAIYTTEAIYAGDTWPGIPSITIRVNGSPPGDPVESARLIFFKAEDGAGTIGQALSTPDEILITDADLWEISIPAIALSLPPGEWTFRFTTVAADTSATTRTWIVGTLTIL